MKKLTFILIFAVLLLSATFAGCSDGNTGDIDTTVTDVTVPDDTEQKITVTDESENGIKVYRVKRLNAFEEINWYSVPAVAIDTYKWVDCDPIEAYAQLVFIEDHGFVCRMTALESEPYARYTEYGDPACLDSCLEFFVTFDGERYINVEANSAGALYVGIGSSRDDHTPADKIFSADEMISVTPEVEEDKWSITIDLTLEDLEKLYGKDMPSEQFSSGSTFGGNFYKTESADNGNEHYGMWNEVKTEMADFHRPEFFGKFIME
ncbi:MAG: carbohydrate-binding family 9-like protein [Clostridia bacterium]|nr:carbohydrate-binding family 9-like protein [Clostridia bacterium]